MNLADQLRALADRVGDLEPVDVAVALAGETRAAAPAR
jgi:hypothetical protein